MADKVIIKKAEDQETPPVEVPEVQEDSKWSNDQTAYVVLGISNDTALRGDIEGVIKQVQAELPNAEPTDWVGRIAEGIKLAIDSDNPLAGQASLYQDILAQALGEVNYEEIALSMLEA